MKMIPCCVHYRGSDEYVNAENGGFEMANKIYIVMKDGETIKELKNLPAAKRFADTESAEVFCEGECVYAPDTIMADQNLEHSLETLEEIPEPKAPVKVETIASEKYVLTAKMNIRKAPSLKSKSIGIAEKGTVVEVTEIQNGWLYLLDGTFILYEGGKWARKC